MQVAAEGVKPKGKKNKKMADDDGAAQHPLEVGHNKGILQGNIWSIVLDKLFLNGLLCDVFSRINPTNLSDV